jgi:hypothetical protein
MSRHSNPAAFIRETVGPSLVSRARSDHRPVLGIDEGLNDRQHVEPMTRRLVARGIVSMATPLWYQSRVLSDGTRINVLGSAISPSSLTPDTGRPSRPAVSWPDEGVVTQLVTYFLTNDRLCLLTHNTRNDLAGLRRILQTEVAPALDALQPKRLGLLALVQKPGSPLNEYCGSVEHWLATRDVEPGLRWQLVPG